jgi:hypothetical protein
MVEEARGAWAVQAVDLEGAWEGAQEGLVWAVAVQAVGV